MGWTRRDRLSARAATRLDALARQWRPTPVEGRRVDGRRVDGETDASRTGVGFEDLFSPPVSPDPWDELRRDPVGRRVRLVAGPWGASALRVLALMVAACLVLIAWWWWSGRPRAIVPAPTSLAPSVLATGAPLPGASGPDTPAPGAANLIAGTRPSAAVGSSAPAIGAAVAVVVVDVTGLVAHPGLVHLRPGSRVADAVEAAGGVTRKGAASSVNLARVVVDGEQVVVGGSGVVAAAGSGGAGASVSGLGGPIDLNSADALALDRLPGVGPVLAARIVQWRAINGPFHSIDELGEVSGIGDAILGQLRPLVRV